MPRRLRDGFDVTMVSTTGLVPALWRQTYFLSCLGDAATILLPVLTLSP